MFVTVAARNRGAGFRPAEVFHVLPATVVLRSRTCTTMPDPETPKRIALFNTVVGLAFAQLYDAFPFPVRIDEEKIADAMGIIRERFTAGDGEPGYETKRLDDDASFEDLCEHTFIWLRAEGFIRWDSREAVLTSKALLTMNAVPAGLTAEKSLGSQLGDAAKEAGNAAGRAAIGDIVGQVIGGVAKSLFG